MGRHKKDCTCGNCKGKSKVKSKVKVNVKSKVNVKVKDKGCSCRKRGNKCISLNPCTECIKQNKLQEEIEKGKVKSGVIKGKSVSNKVKRGPGRPKKLRETEEEVIVIPTRLFKFLGYCPSCKLSIASGDLLHEGGDILNCPKCGKLLKVSELEKTIELDRPKTKKEYFQSINSVHTWHDYNASSNINTIAKKEDPMLDEIEDEHVKSDEDEIISKKHVED